MNAEDKILTADVQECSWLHKALSDIEYIKKEAFSVNISVFWISFYSPVCIVDEDQTAVAVMINKLAQDAGMKVGDSVAIPEPFLTKVKVSHKGKVRIFLFFFAVFSLISL